MNLNLVRWINKTEDNYISNEKPMLSGSLVTMAWHVLRLQMEETASRYGG
jgi:hypothetical protein